MSHLTDAILVLLTEAYAGPPDPSSTWFIDNKTDAGILGLLEAVSASEASTSADGSRQPGTTIAANTEHLRWSLANANRAMQGQPLKGTWPESWDILSADDTAWDRLRQALRGEYEMLRAQIQQHDPIPDEYILDALALVTHAAFHLGVMRQMIERVRAK